jgi:hypothetical protein
VLTPFAFASSLPPSLWPPPPATAARPLELGFTSHGDHLFTDADPAVRNLWLDRAPRPAPGSFCSGRAGRRDSGAIQDRHNHAKREQGRNVQLKRIADALEKLVKHELDRR